VLTGVVLAPLVVWLFLEGPPLARAIVLGLAAVLCLAELAAMSLVGRHLDQIAAIAAGAIFVAARIIRGETTSLDFAVVLIVPALFALARPMPIEDAARRLFTAWGGVIYIAIPMTFTIDLAVAETPWILFALTTVWMGDTMAYFAGRAFGRHPLHPQVSPKKTIEGAIGGLIGSVIGGVAIVIIFELPLAWPLAGVIAGIGGAIAQAGDLAESLIKRAFGVKDSGRILPGHGGMLDRVDGVLFAVPFFHAVLMLLEVY